MSHMTYINLCCYYNKASQSLNNASKPRSYQVVSHSIEYDDAPLPKIKDSGGGYSKTCLLVRLVIF